MAWIQDPNETAIWSDDFTAHLAKNGNLTISSATVTCSTTGVTISQVTTTSTSVTWKQVTSGLTFPQNITVVITPTYSNATTDPRYLTFEITQKTN